MPPGTFPVEIGITIVETGETRTWLIKPAPEWAYLIWDAAAEDIHGISRERLEIEGTPVNEVFDEIVAYAAGHRLLSDSIADEIWVGILARATGRPWIDFELGSVWAEVERASSGSAERVEQAHRRAELQFPKRHGAGSDSARSACLLRILSGLEIDLD